MKTKICTNKNCKHPEKPISEFYKNKRLKSGLASWCKDCQKQILQEHHKKYPWKRTLRDIKRRCDNKKCKDYKNYGGRGIGCRITEDELKELWYRDKAYKMIKPSIHRKKSDKNYVFENCQYIEIITNVQLARNIRVIQFDKNNKFLKEHKSIVDASKGSEENYIIILNCLKSKYIWKFK